MIPSGNRRNVTGGVLFGLGWALAETCPGPVAAQPGRGQLAELCTFAGILAGVALFGYVKRRREAAALSPRGTELVGSAEPGL